MIPNGMAQANSIGKWHITKTVIDADTACTYCGVLVFADGSECLYTLDEVSENVCDACLTAAEAAGI